MASIYSGGVTQVTVTEKRKSTLINIAYFSVLAVAYYFFMKYALDIVAPFVIAFLIALILQRPIRFISQKTKIPQKHFYVAQNSKNAIIKLKTNQKSTFSNPHFHKKMLLVRINIWRNRSDKKAFSHDLKISLCNILCARVAVS